MRILTPGLLALFLALFPTAPPAAAQVVELVPEARQMAAPDWVKPGARMTFYTIESTHSDTGAEPDPRTGEIRRTTSAAGQVHYEITVVASEPGLVAYEIRMYLIPGADRQGPSSLRTITGKTSSTPGAVAEYWIHPAALKALVERKPGEGTSTWSSVKDTLGGKERDAIQVETKIDESTFTWVYDLGTGLLLRANKQVGRPGARFRSLSNTEFEGLEQLDLPWLGAEAPDWVAKTKVIEFEGQYQIVLPGQGTTPSVPQSQRFQQKQVGQGWALYDLTLATGPLASLDGGGVERETKQYISGGGSPSSLWIAPSVLAKLRTAQELFSNAATGFRTRVHYVGPDQGQDICVLRWESPLLIVDYVYDRGSGGLVRVFRHDLDLQTQLYFQLAGTR